MNIIKIYICLTLCLLGVCPFVLSKRLNRKFCVGPHMLQGKVYGCSKLQKFVSESFKFLLNLENAKKNNIKSAIFFCYSFK